MLYPNVATLRKSGFDAKTDFQHSHLNYLNVGTLGERGRIQFKGYQIYETRDVQRYHQKHADPRVGIIAAIIHFHFGLGLKRRILQCCILVWHSK